MKYPYKQSFIGYVHRRVVDRCTCTKFVLSTSTVQKINLISYNNIFLPEYTNAWRISNA